MPNTDDLFADQGTEFAPVPDRLEMVVDKVVTRLTKSGVAQIAMMHRQRRPLDLIPFV